MALKLANVFSWTRLDKALRSSNVLQALKCAPILLPSIWTIAISLIPVLLLSVDWFWPKSSSSDGNTHSVSSVPNRSRLNRLLAASKALNLAEKDVATRRFSPICSVVSATSPLKSQIVVKPVLAGVTIGCRVYWWVFSCAYNTPKSLENLPLSRVIVPDVAPTLRDGYLVNTRVVNCLIISATSASWASSINTNALPPPMYATYTGVGNAVRLSPRLNQDVVSAATPIFLMTSSHNTFSNNRSTI